MGNHTVSEIGVRVISLCSKHAYHEPRMLSALHNRASITCYGIAVTLYSGLLSCSYKEKRYVPKLVCTCVC